ncbi:MAG: hypothetical protein HYW86_00560 [Candidatus Roizmanbacteria bacterium]|nr:MAG: hypothetical protein HYW86_00560 [Candidatus Roizmanbacteria bacterium]
MSLRKIILFFIIVLLTITLPVIFFFSFQYFSKASAVKADIVIDLKRTTKPVPNRWLALAQGGEEKGVRMLENVVPEVSALNPQYIRLDHIYDYYDVVSRDEKGSLVFNWAQLDATICDIYQIGAKPFFSLGYMPPVMSSDGSLIAVPSDWQEWKNLVQKTVERYSGKTTRLCGQITGDWMKDIYYEVWNEPDLETFGKWSLYEGSKDYKTLYYYSVLGASQAQEINNYFIGGPVPTALYKNWIQVFLNYVSRNNLRVDFLSWHHYSKNTDDFTDDAGNLNSWLSPPEFSRYQSLPRIISEWGYDSEPNPIADTNVGAAHTIAALRNFLRYNFTLGFLFDIKDGPTPRWGILGHNGEKKPRYYALKLLSLLEGTWINIEGEGTFVHGLASTSANKTALVLVNYDKDNKNTELVPVTFLNLANGSYTMTITYLEGNPTIIKNTLVENGQLQKSILIPANTVVAIELKLE